MHCNCSGRKMRAWATSLNRGGEGGKDKEGQASVCASTVLLETFSPFNSGTISGTLTHWLLHYTVFLTKGYKTQLCRVLPLPPTCAFVTVNKARIYFAITVLNKRIHQGPNTINKLENPRHWMTSNNVLLCCKDSHDHDGHVEFQAINHCISIRHTL